MFGHDIHKPVYTMETKVPLATGEVNGSCNRRTLPVFGKRVVELSKIHHFRSNYF